MMADIAGPFPTKAKAVRFAKSSKRKDVVVIRECPQHTRGIHEDRYWVEGPDPVLPDTHVIVWEPK